MIEVEIYKFRRAVPDQLAEIDPSEMYLEFRNRYGYTFWTQKQAISAGVFEVLENNDWQTDMDINLSDADLTRMVGNLLQDNEWESFDKGYNDRLETIDFRDEHQFSEGALEYFGLQIKIQ